MAYFILMENVLYCHYSLPSIHYLPPTIYYPLPTACLLLNTYHLLPTPYSPLPTPYYRLPTTYYRLPTTYRLPINCHQSPAIARTAYYPVPTCTTCHLCYFILNTNRRHGEAHEHLDRPKLDVPGAGLVVSSE